MKSHKLIATAVQISVSLSLAVQGLALAADDAVVDAQIAKGDKLMSKLPLTPQQLKLAVSAFQEAVRMNPDSPKAHQRLAAALGASGEDHYETAINEAKLSVKLDPKYFMPHVTLGQVYTNQGKIDDALAEFKQAIQLKPTLRGAGRLRVHCCKKAASTTQFTYQKSCRNSNRNELCRT
ncbi:MAG: tetratricopeptide repeat protein [Candidatus Obscuribacterales bacterium]